MPDLLDKIDGRTVKTARGPVTLATKGAPVTAIEIGFRDRFLNVITDPNVAYVLMMLGMLGLFFELSNPGAILPGVIGGISLILAFFAFQSLPINYAGLLLILFGIVLLIAEIKIVSHGVLAIGGIVAMSLGSLMLFDAPEVGLPRLVVGHRPHRGRDRRAVPVRGAAGLRALTARSSIGTPALVGQPGVRPGPLEPRGPGADPRRAVAGGGPGRARRGGRAGARRRRGRPDPHRREGGRGRHLHDLRRLAAHPRGPRS